MKINKLSKTPNIGKFTTKFILALTLFVSVPFATNDRVRHKSESQNLELVAAFDKEGIELGF